MAYSYIMVQFLNESLPKTCRYVSSIHPLVTEPVLFSPTTSHLLGHNLYFPSYLYVGPIGTLTTLIVGLTVSLITGKETRFPYQRYLLVIYYWIWLLCSAGGWCSKAEPTLTLLREDTMCYHLYRFVKDKVSVAQLGQTGNNCFWLLTFCIFRWGGKRQKLHWKATRRRIQATQTLSHLGWLSIFTTICKEIIFEALFLYCMFFEQRRWSDHLIVK